MHLLNLLSDLEGQCFLRDYIQHSEILLVIMAFLRVVVKHYRIIAQGITVSINSI